MNKTIFITGAGSGIGNATAKYFQSKGWNVVATMRTPEKEVELTNLKNVLVTRLDVTNLLSVINAIDEGIAEFGKIDVLVNNAEYGAYGPLETFPRENIVHHFNTNVIGLLDVTREILPHFRENREGVIVNVSSIGGKMTFPLGSLYHGTKFAVEGISEALQYELEPIGIKVKIVEPGAVAAEFAGCPYDFRNDETLIEYQDTVGKSIRGFEAALSRSSEPLLVAEVIYNAATDGTDKLRYAAGEDAVELIANRQKFDDETFIGDIKARFGLSRNEFQNGQEISTLTNV